ncbi:unnamed protein product [Rotaria magnacalcarata]|uniref:C2H2-type domain-containing protein n=1 Tax=Rotaria magnacalcarata TaxID=392030 RepID=A0A816W846_9BILA|nr:unnamed protein product [Rotaria magnacalcarata]CAF3831221.1 unnamed protein product [Rotaria magnacalcarata]
MPSTTTTTTKGYSNSDYLQPSLSNSHDPSQSPLALLAQTCSNIGNDSPSSPSSLSNIVSPIIKSLPAKSLLNISHSDKPYSLTKRSSPSQLNTINAHKKSTHLLQTNSLSTSSSFVGTKQISNPLTPVFDPAKSAAALLLRSSLAYLTSPQHVYSSTCTISGCLQCETVRYILSNSINTQPCAYHWTSCNTRFYSNDELIEHIPYNHNNRSSKISHHRFHPYFNVSRMINTNDQLPFFYPHLSLSPMAETKQCMNNNINNNN